MKTIRFAFRVTFSRIWNCLKAECGRHCSFRLSSPLDRAASRAVQRLQSGSCSCRVLQFTRFWSHSFRMGPNWYGVSELQGRAPWYVLPPRRPKPMGDNSRPRRHGHHISSADLLVTDAAQRVATPSCVLGCEFWFAHTCLRERKQTKQCKKCEEAGRWLGNVGKSRVAGVTTA